MRQLLWTLINLLKFKLLDLQKLLSGTISCLWKDILSSNTLSVISFPVNNVFYYYYFKEIIYYIHHILAVRLQIYFLIWMNILCIILEYDWAGDEPQQLVFKNKFKGPN